MHGGGPMSHQIETNSLICSTNWLLYDMNFCYKRVNYFCKNCTSQMFGRLLNRSLYLFKVSGGDIRETSPMLKHCCWLPQYNQISETYSIQNPGKHLKQCFNSSRWILVFNYHLVLGCRKNWLRYLEISGLCSLQMHTNFTDLWMLILPSHRN